MQKSKRIASCSRAFVCVSISDANSPSGNATDTDGIVASEKSSLIHGECACGRADHGVRAEAIATAREYSCKSVEMKLRRCMSEEAIGSSNNSNEECDVRFDQREVNSQYSTSAGGKASHLNVSAI